MKLKFLPLYLCLAGHSTHINIDLELFSLLEPINRTYQANETIGIMRYYSSNLKQAVTDINAANISALHGSRNKALRENFRSHFMNFMFCALAVRTDIKHFLPNNVPLEDDAGEYSSYDSCKEEWFMWSAALDDLVNSCIQVLYPNFSLSPEERYRVLDIPYNTTVSAKEQISCFIGQKLFAILINSGASTPPRFEIFSSDPRSRGAISQKPFSVEGLCGGVYMETVGGDSKLVLESGVIAQKVVKCETGEDHYEYMRYFGADAENPFTLGTNCILGEASDNLKFPHEDYGSIGRPQDWLDPNLHVVMNSMLLQCSPEMLSSSDPQVVRDIIEQARSRAEEKATSQVQTLPVVSGAAAPTQQVD